MHRRNFIKQTSSALLLLSSGKIVTLSDSYEEFFRKPVLRFVVASDGHYGQNDTEYEKFFNELVQNINRQHKQKAFDFCMINGDIIHDDKKWFPDAKRILDKLDLHYYVSQGNHDHATAEEWEAIWKMPVNLDFRIKKILFSSVPRPMKVELISVRI